MQQGTFGVERIRPGVLTIDLHRGHLDPEVATLPLSFDTARRVTEANVTFLEEARSRGIPVVHVVTQYRSQQEIASNPFWSTIAGTTATRSNILAHNLSGSAGTKLMPEIRKSSDAVVGMKRRYDCFLGTDLEFTLRHLGVNTLLITGVNTNSCVLATTIIASTKDFACIVIEDCVETVDGPEFHEAALKCLARAFGWVLGSEQVFTQLERSGWSPNRQLQDAGTA